MRMFMKKIAGILIFVLCFSFMPSAIAKDYPFSKAFVTLTRTNLSDGSIFFDDAAGYYLKLENPESVAHRINLVYSITSEFGDVIWTSDEENFEIKAGARVVKLLNPHIDEYGIYKITARLTGDFEIIEISDSFSITAKNYGQNNFMGVQTHFNRSDELSDITSHQVKNGGYGWCREGYDWSMVEREKGSYVTPEIDYDLNKLIESGIDVLLMLDFRNELYDDNTLPKSTDGINAYADFCKWTAKHFQGKINTFEIGNEPDHIDYAGREVTGEEYARLLKAARDAIKSVDENITVVGGALCSYSNEENREFLQEFMTEISSNGTVFDYMDAFSFHPYNDTGLYSDEEKNCTFLENVDYVKSQLGEDIPIWISEYGTSSCVAGVDTDWSYTERQQAANLVRTAIAAKTDLQIEKFNIYNFHEKGKSLSWQHNYGIVDSEYNAKPAYLSLSFMNRSLCDAEYIGKYANKDYYSSLENYFGLHNRAFDVYRFKKGSEDIFVLWEHTGKSSNLMIEQGTGIATTIAENGNNAVISAGDGYIYEIRDMYGNIIDGETIELTDEPVYVILKPETKFSRNGNQIHIEGYAKEPMADVTLMAISRGEFEENIIAVSQTKADENGKFGFDTKISTDAYWFYVAENGEKQTFGEAPDYDISTEYKETADKITAQVTLSDNTGAGNKLILFGAIYGEKNCLDIVKMKETEWNDSKAILNIELSRDDKDIVKLLLWDENQTPVTQALIIGKDR